MAGDASEADEGWSIHVPSAGFQTAEVEDDGPDPLAPSPIQLRAAVRTTEAGATEAPADDGLA